MIIHKNIDNVKFYVKFNLKNKPETEQSGGFMYGVKRVGELKYKKSDAGSCSKLGIGFEKLDRALYDPSPLYDELANIGMKWVRLQSGWCRTEKQKGVYDFSWLDEIVDNLIKRSMKPWMCLCYGNGLYTPEADNKYGDIGRPPIATEEERVAWRNYVSACVEHFKGRVDYFEIWNEPDGKHCWRHGVNATEYGEFAIMTAKAIREKQPDAKIIAGSFFTEISYVYDMLKTGLAPYIDYISYHRYKYVPDSGVEKFTEALRATIRLFSDKIQIIQGETGTHSRYCINGALPGANWSERKQAKFLLRKLVGDLAYDVEFTSYFTAADIFENIMSDSGTKTEEFYGFFGVLGENFDENGIPLGTYYQKQSYRAFRTLCSVMDGREKHVHLPIYFEAKYSPVVGGNDEFPFSNRSDTYMYGFELPNNVYALAYWKGTDILTTDFVSTVSAKSMGLPEEVHIIDLMDGAVYELEPSVCASGGDGKVVFTHIPIRDYPILLVFGNIKSMMK